MYKPSDSQTRPSIKRRVLAVFIALICLALLVGALLFLKARQFSTMTEMGELMAPPPPSISTAIAEDRNWSDAITSVGTLEAARGVTLTAELPGRITKINFTGGETVKKGDILVEQDLSTEKAQLRAARANADLAKVNLDRLRELFGKGVVSKAELDRASAEYRALLAQSQGVASSANKKSIIAPFDGTLGIRLVDIGQEVSAGTGLVSLQALDPILANFALPQSYLPELEQGQTVLVTSNAHPGQEFVGELIAVNSLINERTRNLTVQAQLSNSHKKLLPGMFVSGSIETGQNKPVVVVPLTSVKFASYGDSVFTVEPDLENSRKEEQALRVVQQFVKLGRVKGDFIEIVSGINAGQTVAAGGVFKLQNNQIVQVNNTIDVPMDESPDVANK